MCDCISQVGNSSQGSKIESRTNLVSMEDGLHLVLCFSQNLRRKDSGNVHI